MDRDNQQQTVSDFEIGWLAGIIEGEGSIVLPIHKRVVGKTEKGRRQNLRVTPRIIITNTDKALIEKCVSILDRFGVGKWVRHTKPNNITHGKLINKSFKEITYIYIDGFKRMQKLLNVLAPHFGGEKKARIDILLEFINRRMDTAERTERQQNFQYDKGDIELMLKFLKLTRTHNYDKIAGMLNEFTHDAPLSRKTIFEKRVKMYSELTGNSESGTKAATAA